MKYATNDQLAEMIRAQEVLNKKYNGPNWRRSVKLGWAKAAMLDEVSEMFREITCTWKWWGNPEGATLNRIDGIFEFIDVLHFALLLALFHYDEDQLIFLVDRVDADMGGAVGDPHNYFIKAVTRFMKAIDDQNVADIVKGLKNLIDTGSILMCQEEGIVYRAYLKKNERNHKRVEGGVMEGKYDKSQEESLKL